MYHNEIKRIIEKILKGEVDKYVLMEYLTNNFDCEKIYDSDEELVTDAYFTLKHYASGEEDVAENEFPKIDVPKPETTFKKQTTRTKHQQKRRES